MFDYVVLFLFQFILSSFAKKSNRFSHFFTKYACCEFPTKFLFSCGFWLILLIPVWILSLLPRYHIKPHNPNISSGVYLVNFLDLTAIRCFSTAKKATSPHRKCGFLNYCLLLSNLRLCKLCKLCKSFCIVDCHL